MGRSGLLDGVSADYEEETVLNERTIVDDIQEFVEIKLEQTESRFDRLINSGQVVEARRHGAAADMAKSILKFIEAKRCRSSV